MIRHDYDSDKTQKTEKGLKKQQQKKQKEAFLLCPSFAGIASREWIMALCEELISLPKDSNGIIINWLQGNDYQPVTVKMIENKFAKHGFTLIMTIYPENTKDMNLR